MELNQTWHILKSFSHKKILSHVNIAWFLIKDLKHTWISCGSLLLISALYWGKMSPPRWLSLDWVFFCFITQGDVCCHGNSESRGWYSISLLTEQRAKWNIIYHYERQTVFTLLCHLSITAGTVIMSWKSHYSLSQFGCNSLLCLCQLFH